MKLIASIQMNKFQKFHFPLFWIFFVEFLNLHCFEIYFEYFFFGNLKGTGIQISVIKDCFHINWLKPSLNVPTRVANFVDAKILIGNLFFDELELLGLVYLRKTRVAIGHRIFGMTNHQFLNAHFLTNL